MCVAKRFIDLCDLIYLWNNILQTGIFSATVAAFLIDSYKSLNSDPADVSTKLLRQIVQDLAVISNGQRLTPPIFDDAFTPPRYAIHVNILWFLSLCLSLACGLGATLVKQWLRRYIRLTQYPDVPIRRVRVRMFLFEGIQAFHVSRVVENISVMLHAAIFLFFAGLVEFLFVINDEVAEVIVVVISILAAVYVTLTLLPAIFRRCPFQTPLTSVLWYMGHGLAIPFLCLFKFSSHIRTRIEELQKHVREGMDLHLMNMMTHKADLDKRVLESTLNMCRGEDELEAFLDAIPGYLQMDGEVGTYNNRGVGIRIHDINFLLSKGRLSPLHYRLARLFDSCANDRRTMDEVARRHRAITCCRAIWEISNASLSNNIGGMILDLPESIDDTLQHLTFDSDSAIAISALRAVSIFKRALLEHSAPRGLRADARGNTGPNQSDDTVAARAGNIDAMNDPLSMPYSARRRNNERSVQRLNTVTEFTSRILELIPQLDKPSHMDLQETRMTLEGLCIGLNGENFPPDARQRLASVLNRVPPAPDPVQLVSTGMLCP